jgi:anthranilate phosphoribosyltransferase
VLEALGVKIDAAPETIAQCITEAGVGFMFAPMFHPATKCVQPVRKALGFRTVFNILGPLSNPAHVKAQVLGVADEKLMPMMIEALRQLGIQRAMVVSSDGLDEVSTLGPTQVAELKDGQVEISTFDPTSLGIARPEAADLQVADARDSAASLRRVLAGEDRGPKRDIIALNAAASIQVAGLADSWETALAQAQASIDSGKALAALEAMVEISNR